MLSVEEALEKILSYVSPMGPVEVDLPDALGLTLAEEITSPAGPAAAGQLGHGRLRGAPRRRGRRGPVRPA